MKQIKKHSVLAAAVAITLSVMGWNQSASAQYRVGQDGHANDANNRIGSGGYNGNRTNYPNQYGTASNILNNQVNNQIVTGNVAGLNYFHGQTSEFDPNVIQTNTGALQTDRFLAVSGPTNEADRRTGAQATPFYNNDRVAVQPTNFTPSPNGGGMIPSQPVNTLPGDTRLGTINSPMNNVMLAAPGELDLPGPVDASGNPSSLVASPLYGMRQWSPNDAGDAYFLSRYTNVLPNGPTQAARANNAQIQQMRNELNSTIVPNGNVQSQQNSPGNNTPGGNNDSMGNGGASSTGIKPSNANLADSAQLNSPTGLSAGTSLSSAPLNTNVNDSALNSNPNNAPGVRQQLMVLVPPDQQSAQLRDLEQRLSRSRNQMNSQQAADAYNEERRLNAADQKKAEDAKMASSNTGGNATTTPPANTPDAAPATPTPDQGMTTATPSAAPKPDEQASAAPLNPVLTGPMTGGNVDKPYIITSLATGIKAKGLADLLTTAENQMRQGKFSTALDTYDTARAVAPNNPFATLGRAFAELGAASYGGAERDLRAAFQAESGAVLLGQYDLRGFLGEDRLKFVVKDLKEIDAREKNERAAFLLAYIAHNVGDEESAGTYLTEAEERAGANDPAIAQMRETWQLKKQ